MAMKTKQKKYLIPNVFTALNVLCGFLSILYAVNNQPDAKDFIWVPWLIILAGIFDTLDGKIARMTKSYSEFGIEFDSLADVVSFGVAPSVMIYRVYFSQYGTFGVVLSFLPLLFGSIRLARFNVQLTGFEKHGFIGLPIPMAAAGISTFILLSMNETLPFVDPRQSLLKPFLTPLVLLVCLLMVSTLPYDPLPKFSFRRGWVNVFKLTYLVGGVILIIFFPALTFFPLVMLYVMSGILRWIFFVFKTNTNVEDMDEDDASLEIK
jgi:CDP-diacylglycerol--serine O-phosphatidyltransferase